MDIYTFIVAGHIIGTILGTGGATIAEFQIAKALIEHETAALIRGCFDNISRFKINKIRP